ncbi:MAG: M20/M25/M40 family metallo-hydrolase [Eubacterium sp.]|nr:M20/M25/M40 family metallo-hydrolase [Eubacterium sp.]
MNTEELLYKLTGASGVSGDEGCITKVLCELLEPYGEVTTDAIGNVFVTFGEGYHYLLDAHIDEIGMIVKAVTDDGFIKVEACGGVDNRMLLSSEVTVWGREKLCGVISNIPPHLQKDDDSSKAPKLEDVAIDVGLTKDEADKLIAPGDRVTFRRNFERLCGTQLCSNVLDDRSGVAALILAINKLKGADCKVTAMFSVQEELGMRGSTVGAFGKAVDEAIAVDVSFGYSPKCKKSDCGIVGKGPMIGVAPVLDREMSDKLVKTAEDNNIPYQLEVMGGNRTGTNADAISLTESGIRTSLISIPLKYMHSPVEVIDIKDVENTAELIAAYVLGKAGA